MWEILNNASVAAFFGAFFAFMLVVVSGWLKRRRQKSTLRFLISDNLDHARKKRRSTQVNIELLQEANKVMDSPYIRFPVQSVRDHQFQILDLLSAAEKQGLDTLIFWMDAIDELLFSATSKATELKALVQSDASIEEKSEAADQYSELLHESDKNLALLCTLCEYYVEGMPEKIIDFQHPIS